ncbi:hypothetical protein ACFPM0_14895 [Pseudonocardia sulfidoxydans]|uniref:hypothetical protein n=1 Tax=Pseudonocardia sulfidoxydans TaxID=54011 RepID=UPI00361132C0
MRHRSVTAPFRTSVPVRAAAPIVAPRTTDVPARDDDIGDRPEAAVRATRGPGYRIAGHPGGRAPTRATSTNRPGRGRRADGCAGRAGGPSEIRRRSAATIRPRR